MDEVREDVMSQRERQLQSRPQRERERAHHLSEIVEQREERLRKRRDRDRARRAANTAKTAELFTLVYWFMPISSRHK